MKPGTNILTHILLGALILGNLTLAPVSADPYDFGIRAKDWNGEYWLMATMEGDLVKYNGQEFSYLADLGCTPLEIKWAGDYWLMGCREVAPGKYWLKPKDRLIKYDGGNFVNLSLDYAPQKIACSREYCLMFGSAKDERIMKYDGSTLMDITKYFSIVSSVPWINEMDWNGEYWLITTSEDLIKYDGAAFLRIDIENLSTSTQEWNGEYWLIVLREKQNITVGYKPHLFKYDGKVLTELMLPAFFDVTELKQEGLGYLVPNKLVWNGKYWLMSTYFSKLIKYDGKTFKEVVLPTNRTGEARGVNDIAWNGEYWLLSYPVSPGDLRIAKYDGENFIELTDIPDYAMLTIFGWTGKYWLIGTSYSEPFGILRYDGSSFIDLTEKFTGIVSSRVAPEPPRPPPPPPRYFPIFLALLLFELVLIPVLLWKIRKKRGVLYGAVWGLIGLIVHVILEGAKIMRAHTWIIEIIALPTVIYAKGVYKYGEIVLKADLGGTFYYSPLIVLPVSVAIGAVIGYGIEKGYQKVKGKR